MACGSACWGTNGEMPPAVMGLMGTVVSIGHFRSKALDTEDKFTFTFTTPGSFEYFCSLHPHMQGTVVVEAAPRSNATQ